MNATEQDIAMLEKLAEIDRKVAAAQKQFDELPHRQAILDLRDKKKEVVDKKMQVQDMLDQAEMRLGDLAVEDDALTLKQQNIQATLEEVKGDYRAVNAHTRELDGVRKRRDKVALELSRVEEQVAKIQPVMKQVMEALTALDQKEAELVSSFQKTGGGLRSAIAEGSKARDELAAKVSPEILDIYEKTRVSCGGVAVSRLQGNSCSVCRNAFDQGRVLAIKAEAPLAVCPSCRRLMVVDE